MRYVEKERALIPLLPRGLRAGKIQGQDGQGSLGSLGLLLVQVAPWLGKSPGPGESNGSKHLETFKQWLPRGPVS